MTLDEDRIIRAVVSDQEFDARVTAYVGTCGDQLSCIARTRNAFAFSDQSIDFPLPAGTTAYIHVSGDEFVEVGAFTITIEVCTFLKDNEY